MKRIIITGGCGGIGSQLSKAFLEDSYLVTIIGRSQEKFIRLFGKIQSNRTVEFYQINVASIDEVNKFYSNIKISSISLYGLVNVAGLQPPIGRFELNKPDEWVENLSVNLIGTVNMIRGVLPFFRSAGIGKIINFSGGGATTSRSNFSAYAVSKTAIVRFTEILAEELKECHIDINAVAPGAINTGMLNEILDAGENAGKEYLAAVKRKKVGGASTEKIVDLCRFLLSDQSDGISGKLISAIWDDYRNPAFIERLRTDSDFCCLRRIDSINFDTIK